MIRTNSGEASRVMELAFVGYYVDMEEPETQVISPVAAGRVSDGLYTNFETAFDGNTAYDPETKQPVLTYAGNSPSMFIGRSVFVDFGENWRNIRIQQTWTYYRAWSQPNGIGLTSMRWSNNNTKSLDGIPETRLAFHMASGNLGSAECWKQDTDWSNIPVTPKARYLIIDVPDGYSNRLAELAFIGYIVN